MARAKSAGGSDAASLALRIATMALSVASAVMMSSATQPTASGSRAPASNVSYSDYNSLRYSLAANVISAALQAAAAYLTVRGRAEEAKAAKSLAELVDTAAQVLLYSSSALSFAVDDFGSCDRWIRGVCKTAGEFCRRVCASGAISLSAAVALSVSLYIKDVPISVSLEGAEPIASISSSNEVQSASQELWRELHVFSVRAVRFLSVKNLYTSSITDMEMDTERDVKKILELNEISERTYASRASVCGFP